MIEEFLAYMRYERNRSGRTLESYGRNVAIFERFFKIDSFTPGCGLGLYICKSFVEMMGGQISFDSEMGKGSVFKRLLP